MLKIEDFQEPKIHPYEMLRGYNNASEKESLLAFILGENIKSSKFEPVKTKYSHPTMVEDGLLIDNSTDTEHKYSLTKKSIGLLYSVYGKE